MFYYMLDEIRERITQSEVLAQSEVWNRRMNE